MLTARQQAVLQLLADGLSRSEISKALKCAIKTVDAHRYMIRRCLGLPSVTTVRLIERAKANGWLGQVGSTTTYRKSVGLKADRRKA